MNVENRGATDDEIRGLPAERHLDQLLPDTGLVVELNRVRHLGSGGYRSGQRLRTKGHTQQKRSQSLHESVP